MNKRITDLDVAQVHLDNIYARTSNEYFSKTMAERIVGGSQKLLQLIESGAVQCIKRGNSRNAKWFCNAAQVLRHCALSRTA